MHKQLPLTRRYITELLPAICNAAGIENADQYKGHSFRRGGATSLARAGVHDHTIKKMGRWKSGAYHLYIDHSDNQVRQAAVQAATYTTQSCVTGKNVNHATSTKTRRH